MKLRKVPFEIDWELFESAVLPEFSGELPAGGSGKKVFFPENGTVNLFDYFVSPPDKAQRTYLAGEFSAAEAQQILIGFGAEWNWKFFFNGELILDAMDTGNQQMPYAEDNHLVLLDCRKGKNQHCN